ncbi:MAG: SH3 domain-containing protein [Candidatus Omnitrophica bacterium]|nr:SH3 domain-containing protein [Candidatus Omnitrophota bacterium]
MKQMNLPKWWISLSFLAVFCGPLLTYAENLPPLPAGPLLLTSVKPAQLDPDYWIKRLPEPDRVIKTPAEMEKFNEEIRGMIRECVDVFKLDRTRPGRQISDQLQLEYNTLKGRVLFGADDKPVPKTFFEKQIRPLVVWENVPKTIKMKWGAAARATSVRALPSNVKMIEDRGDYEFDQLQFTLIKLWTPVGIFYESSDGQWLYIQAPYVRGWVKAKDIAVFSSRDELKRYVKSKNFLSVTGESIPVFSDAGLSKVVMRVTMGTILPLAASAKEGAAYTVWLPLRGTKGSVSLTKAYVNGKSDVTKGFLSYTQRHIIQQAFKLLGVRYGWGGMYNGRDCSGFTHDVFLSLGVAMPRDSKQQAFIGTQLSHFEPFEGEKDKTAFLRQATPGLTLLRMPHHMMLYLGEENGNFYVIHATWAERISMTSDEKNRINQVVVSDLNLNGKSRIGSLFDRIITMNEVN